MIRGWIDFLLNLSWRLTRSQPTTSRQKSGPCGGKQTTPWPPRRLPTAVRRSGRGSTEALTGTSARLSSRRLPLPKAGMPGLPFSISWGLIGNLSTTSEKPFSENHAILARCLALDSSSCSRNNLARLQPRSGMPFSSIPTFPVYRPPLTSWNPGKGRLTKKTQSDFSCHRAKSESSARLINP